ncbi:class I SAM-dependent methyltransferase [Wenyingzhuangia sp. IMCC45533]
MLKPIRKNTYKKQPWPTKDAMAQVYEMKLWGGEEHDFYSGEGSHKEQLVKPYVNVVSSFLSSFTNPPTVCDLGCGDFNVGAQLLSYAKRYTAVDIVPALIVRNKQKFNHPNLSFDCLNIAEDTLPKADVVVIRQVLQHLSNKEIKAAIKKLEKYKYIILTEHIPNGEFEPNQDIISGQGIRLKKKSGVDITKEPFNLKYVESKDLLMVPLEKKLGVIKTTLYSTY